MFALSPSRRGALQFCAVLAAVAALGASALAQQRIGVNSAVNPNVEGNPPPGASMRRLVIGQQVVYNEHLVTNPGGQTQILFVDESAMTIGPNSDMVIDQFVYNPKAGTGRLLASLTKGVFRFVGGRLSKQPNAIAIKTPAATIGIRGGVFLADLTPQGRLEVVFVFGDGLTVTGANGATSTISRPGYAVVVNSPGAIPTAPFRVARGVTSRLLAQLDGRRGGSGGAKQVPTEATIAASGIATDISGNPETIQVAQQPVRTVDVAATTTEPEEQVASSLSQPVVVSSSGATSGSIGSSPQGTPIAGGFYSTGSSGAALGFGSPTSYSGTLSGDTITASIGGSKLELPASFVSPDDTFAFGELVPGAGLVDFYYGGQAVNPQFYQPTGSERFFVFNVSPDAALESGIPFIRNGAGGDLLSPTVSELYMTAPADSSFAGPLSGGVTGKALQASLAINGQGASQTSVLVLLVGNPLATEPQPTLVGQIGGSYLASGTSQPIGITGTYSSALDGSGNSFYGGNEISGFVLSGSPTETTLPSDASTDYTFVQAVTAASLPSGVGSSVSTRTLSGFMGGIMTEETGSPLAYALTGSASISTNASTLSMAATFSGTDPLTAATSGINSMILQYGNLGAGTGAAQAFIDDNLFGSLESPVNPTLVNGSFADATTFMVSSDVVPSTALLPSGVSYCSCQYLEWGYWGGEVDSVASDGTVRVDYGHINTWVAGVPTASTDISNLQSMGAKASYAGAAVGTVFNNGAQYLAAGGYSGTYNFGTQSGTMQITNFDGRNFGGAISGSGGTYSAALSGSGLAGFANGIFFGPGAIETGGNFAVQGTGIPYFASGIFAGRQTGS